MNETLARQGFISATPKKPVIAFSFKPFDVYCQLHRVCPRLSLDAFARALNHLHQVGVPFFLFELKFPDDFS
jgi:hypothetical protein